MQINHITMSLWGHWFLAWTVDKLMMPWTFYLYQFIGIRLRLACYSFVHVLIYRPCYYGTFDTARSFSISSLQLITRIVGSTEAPSKVFLLSFLCSDWLKSNRTSFFGIFSRHICSAVTETMRVTNYATSFGAKNVQKTKVEAAEMILDPLNQQRN